jgi:2-oxoisovalerate dehydrogenase E1 component
MSQIVNQAAKLRYMSNGRISVPMVIWAGVGAIKSAGPHHSGSLYPWFMHVPGLKVVLPSNPADAKGLLAAAIRDNDPVIFCAHKLLFPRRGAVPLGEHLVPLGRAALLRPGTDATIVATGNLVHVALAAAEALSREGVECEVMDLRTLAPLDRDALVASAARTGRLLVVDEAYAPCGVGAEVAALLNEHAWRYLRAPVLRLHTAFVSHPFSPVFDEVVLPGEAAIRAQVHRLMEGGAAPPATTLTGARAAVQHAPGTVTARVSAASEVRMAPPAAVPGRIAVQIPNQGLTVEEARIVRWLVAPGEQVAEGQALLEIETDKVVQEVLAEAEGVVESILEGAEAVLPLGAVIGYLRHPSTAT